MKDLAQNRAVPVPVLILVGVVLIGLSSRPVRADRRGPSPQKPWSVQGGAVTRVAPLYAGSSTYGADALPFVRISYRNRYSLGPRGLRARLGTTDSLELDVGLVYQPGRDEVEDSNLGGARDDRLD